MTHEEKLKILKEAEHRAYEEIQATPGKEMGSESFYKLLAATDQFRWMIHCLEHPEQPDEEDFTPPEPAAQTEEQTIHEPDPEPAPAPDPEPTYTRDQMISKLTHYINKCGVDVNSLIAEYQECLNAQSNALSDLEQKNSRIIENFNRLIEG